MHFFPSFLFGRPNLPTNMHTPSLSGLRGRWEYPQASECVSKARHHVEQGQGRHEVRGRGATDGLSPDSTFWPGTPRVLRNLHSVLVSQGLGKGSSVSGLEATKYFTGHFASAIYSFGRPRRSVRAPPFDSCSRSHDIRGPA